MAYERRCYPGFPPATKASSQDCQLTRWTRRGSLITVIRRPGREVYRLGDGVCKPVLAASRHRMGPFGLPQPVYEPQGGVSSEFRPVKRSGGRSVGSFCARTSYETKHRGRRHECRAKCKTRAGRSGNPPTGLGSNGGSGACLKRPADFSRVTGGHSFVYFRPATKYTGVPNYFNSTDGAWPRHLNAVQGRWGHIRGSMCLKLIGMARVSFTRADY